MPVTAAQETIYSLCAEVLRSLPMCVSWSTKALGRTHCQCTEQKAAWLAAPAIHHGQTRGFSCADRFPGQSHPNEGPYSNDGWFPPLGGVGGGGPEYGAPPKPPAHDGMEAQNGALRRGPHVAMPSDGSGTRDAGRAPGPAHPPVTNGYGQANEEAQLAAALAASRIEEGSLRQFQAGTAQSASSGGQWASAAKLPSLPSSPGPVGAQSLGRQTPLHIRLSWYANIMLCYELPAVRGMQLLWSKLTLETQRRQQGSGSWLNCSGTTAAPASIRPPQCRQAGFGCV